ncbi:mor transcription activator family protein [Salmonella enterica]|nr:mor transcription activator family protein [Salmonella enterica]
MQCVFTPAERHCAPPPVLNLLSFIPGNAAGTLAIFTRRDFIVNAITFPDADRLPVDCLPEDARELIRLLGYDSALRLVRTFGGVSLSGRTGAARERSGGVYRFLVDVLSREEIARITAWTGGAEFYIPRCDAAIREQRNACFIRDYHRLLDGGFSGRCAMAWLCPRYGFSDRRGWAILKRWRESNAHNRG